MAAQNGGKKSQMICPDCKWETPSTNYRFRSNDEIYIYKESEVASNSSYPKILDFYIDWKLRKVYREVHRCPNCKFEFEQTIIE